MAGRLQRQIYRAFLAKPPGALLTTGELIAWCYPRRAGLVRIDQCRHVRRAAAAVADPVGKGWRSNMLWRLKPSQKYPHKIITKILLHRLITK